MLVYPGGDWETFRPIWHSDRIEFGGRKGFIKLALERGVPIVPVVAIGGQETALFVTRGERAAEATGWAKLTRIKVLPVAFGPPFGATVLDLPGRFPFRKITVEVDRRSTLSSASGLSPSPSPNRSIRRSPAKCRAGWPSSKKNAHCLSSDRQRGRLGPEDLAEDRVAHRPVREAVNGRNH